MCMNFEINPISPVINSISSFEMLSYLCNFSIFRNLSSVFTNFVRHNCKNNLKFFKGMPYISQDENIIASI